MNPLQKTDLPQTADLGPLLDRIHKDRMLLTAGTPDHLGTMTVSWGNFGILWHKPMATIFVRPERHTYQFLEAKDYFSLAFFDPTYKDALTFCGKHSGRDVDKVKACNFTVAEGAEGGVYFKEATLVLICQKRYRTPLDLTQMQGFDPTPFYGPHGNLHTMYMGEIVEVYTR